MVPPSDSESKADWWRTNDELRERLGLPSYTPPRFADGSYTHGVIEGLEDTHGCTIRFVGVDTQYPEDLEVRIDGDPAFSVGRHRDERGNTVYEMSADEFREAVEDALDADGGGGASN